MTTKEKIIYALILVWILVVIGMILWYIFGSSPTLEDFISVIIVGPYIFIFTIYDRLNNRINDNYEKLNDKISEIKIQLGRIEGKVTKSK